MNTNIKTFDFNDPTKWEFIATCCLYNPASEDMAGYVSMLMGEVAEANGASHLRDAWDWEMAQANRTEGGRFDRKGTCDHCGAHFHYGAAYKNAETDEVAIVGHICATNKLNLTANEYAYKAAQKLVKAARQRKLGDARMAALAPNRNKALLHDHYITSNIRSSFRKWGSLSLKQWALVKKLVRDDAERAAAKAAEPTPVAIPDELLTGRHVFTGTVLGTKFVSGFNGMIEKMLVLDNRGFKIWGTVPNAADAEVRGKTVEFAATLQASNDDPCFGFFKRPTKFEMSDRA